MIKKETWKDVVGFEGYYKVSNLGRVKSLNRTIINKNNIALKVNERILKYENHFGYYRVSISKNNKKKQTFVHRLVAEAFLPKIQNKPFVNHINEIRNDNRVDNLEWCNRVENRNHGTAIQRTKLNTLGKNVKKVFMFDLHGNFLFEFKKLNDVSEVGLSPSKVSLVCNGKRKTHKGHIFKFNK